MFIAALLDLLMVGASLISTVLFARRWLHVLVIGVAVGAISEALLTAQFGDRLLGCVIGADAAIDARVSWSPSARGDGTQSRLAMVR